jgi:hypothetical protein
MHGAERVLPVVSSRALIRTVRACNVRGSTVRAWNWLSGAGLSRDELTRTAHPRRVLPRICMPSLSRPERDLPGRRLAERRLTELPGVCRSGMRDLPVLPGGGLALRILALVELIPCVLARTGWRLPVLAVVHWARLARGVLLRALRVGGVWDDTLLCLAIWPLTVRPLVVARRTVWS